MKLPKGFGNMGGIMKQAQEAMERAKNLEQELAMMEVEVDRGGVKAKFNGVGEILGVKIDPSLVDPADIESLEDSVLLALREGHAKANDLRQKKVTEITGGLPLPPGMNPF
ncbi:MAG: YbaB/EbfC family nucleoid-associated protein [Fimbriimonadales bacterium]